MNFYNLNVFEMCVRNFIKKKKSYLKTTWNVYSPKCVYKRKEKNEFS